MLPPTAPVDATAVLGRRFVAFLVDGLIAVIIFAAVFFAVSDTLNGAGFFLTCADVRDAGGTSLCLELGDDLRYAEGSDATLVYAAIGAFTFLNMAVLQAAGGTIGKRLLGLAVVRQDTGANIGFGKALLRWLVSLVDLACCAIVGGILVLTTKGHRRLADMAAGSVVVARSSRGTPPSYPGSAAAAAALQWAPGAPPAGSSWAPGAPPAGSPWAPPTPGAGAPGGVWGPPAGQPNPWEPPSTPAAQADPWAPPTTPAAADPWAPPAAEPPAAQSTPAATAGVPQWDPARNAYILWDAPSGQWLQFDDAAQEWRPIS